LDTLFTHFENVKCLIIDVRDNIVGNDEFAYEWLTDLPTKNCLLIISKPGYLVADRMSLGSPKLGIWNPKANQLS